MSSNRKEPWGENTPWKNSTAFFNFLRGCLRKAWSTHPTKLILLKNKRYQIPNPNPKGKKATVWGADCAMCKGTFVIKDIQVDHIVPAGQLNKTEDIQGFVERLLYVTEDDLRLVCKECNSALSYSDKQGITYEEAICEKKSIQKTKQSAENQKKELLSLGFTEDEIRTASMRRECYRKYFRERSGGRE